MAFIKNEDPYKIENWVTTTKEHSNLAGTMEIGTKVQIMNKTEHGYSIQDEEGNLITECGWII